jgi:CMP-N-acetylneuraminic acid synthetase
LCGKPLLAYTVETALRSKLLSRLVLSTEDAEIAEVGRSLGAEVPFLRPPELAQDETPMFPVVKHAVETLEAQSVAFDAVCLLQPTNPFRMADDIDSCIQVLFETGSDSVVSVLRVPDTYNPKWVYWKSEDGSLKLSTGEDEPTTRRQELPDAFHREGSIYVTRRDVIDMYSNLYGLKIRGYEVDSHRSVNIDTMEDWNKAAEIIARRTAKRDSACAELL